MTRAIVVLPTYNEAENLPLIVPAILNQHDSLEVLVCLLYTSPSPRDA